MFTEGYLENYKLSTEFIKNTFKMRILEAFKGLSVPEEYQEQMLSVSLATPKLIETMNNYPSIILAMFDKENVFYFTTILPHEKTNKFIFTKAENGSIIQSLQRFSNRRDAEYAALMDALNHMEELLSTKEQLT